MAFPLPLTRGGCTFLFAALFLLSAAPFASADEPPPPADGSPPADDQKKQERKRIRALAREGRELAKADHFAEGLAKISEAQQQAQRAGLAPEDQGDIADVYGRALHWADRDDESLVQFQRARTLSPRDSDIARHLAKAYDRAEQYDQAIREAQAALQLGAQGEDAEDAREVIKDARDEKLHDQVQFTGDVSYGYDSNILEGSQVQTIANRNTRSTGKQFGRQVLTRRALKADLSNLDLYEKAVRADYRMPSPQHSQAGLPLDVTLDSAGRPAGNRRIGLYLGYRFTQTFITWAQPDPTGQLPDPDSYNFQEHRVSVGLRTQALPWLDLSVRAEGLVNFSGLVQFTPYQCGIAAVLDALFIESRRWRTRLQYTHEYDSSFDQVADGYLNANTDRLKIYEELRTRWARPQLGYQFTSDQTGELPVQVPVAVTVKGQQQDIGSYTYFAPLSYLGHQVFGTAKLLLPREIKLTVTLRYEYQSYDGLYRATYTGNKAFPLPTFQVDAQQRRDNRITFEFTLRKELPRGFAVEAHYNFVDNLSNIVNAVDNRSYTKHTALVEGEYVF